MHVANLPAVVIENSGCGALVAATVPQLRINAAYVFARARE
jgi:hypothetical protein